MELRRNGCVYVKPHSSWSRSEVAQMRRLLRNLSVSYRYHRVKALDYDVRMVAIRQRLEGGRYCG
jgi:hypothetical protein